MKHKLWGKKFSKLGYKVTTGEHLHKQFKDLPFKVQFKGLPFRGCVAPEQRHTGTLWHNVALCHTGKMWHRNVEFKNPTQTFRSRLDPRISAAVTLKHAGSLTDYCTKRLYVWIPLATSELVYFSWRKWKLNYLGACISCFWDWMPSFRRTCNNFCFFYQPKSFVHGREVKGKPVDELLALDMVLLQRLTGVL